LLGLDVCWLGLRFRRAGAALDELDIAAGGGSGEEDAFESEGAQHAPVQVGEDGGETGCAEAGGDGIEAGGGGTMADGFDKVAAVVEEDTERVEEDRDVVGQGGGGVIRCGMGRGRRRTRLVRLFPFGNVANITG
jgi:hypothetical protein